MFEIKIGTQGEVVLSGRFDAAQEQKANEVFDALTEPKTVDFKDLAYISSLGLGVLLRTQKRLVASRGAGLTLVNLSAPVHDVFRYSGLTQVFDVRRAAE